MKQFKTTVFRLFALLLILCMLLPIGTSFPASALEAKETEEMESRKTPLMGWASWNAYRTNISEETILSQAKMLVELGLDELGYVYVNIDDGWQNGRGADGKVQTNTARFPSGMKALADAIHEMGLKAGIYTDAGASTCGWQYDGETNNDDVGLYGYDTEDLNRYLVEWGYDFIKVDWCGGTKLGLNQQERYTAIGKVIADIEKATGTDKIYNVCSWSFPGEWVVDVADSWRTGGDISSNFDSILYQIDNIKSLAKYNGPGHVNDLDMMQVGNGMTYDEDKSHFTMWCMMSTPLMLGMDLNSLSEETLSIISNKELIAVNQDPACIQATVAATYGNVEAWTKDLGSAGSGKKAIALLNRGNEAVTLTVSFEELGLNNVSVVRDLWSHEDVATGEYYTVTIPAHGTVALTAEGDTVVKEDTDVTIPDSSNPTASMTVAQKPASVNLTELGSYDWVHFASQTTKKANSPAEISLAYDGSLTTYDSAAARYTWTDGAETKTGSSQSGIGVIGLGAYMTVSIPCDENLRTLTVAVGSYSADVRIELIVGGKVIDSADLRSSANQKVDRLVTVTCQSDIPTTAHLRWTVVRSLGNSDSVNVEGVALSLEARCNSLSAPTLTTDTAGTKVTAETYMTVTDENARLYWVLKKENGELVTLHSEAVAPSEKALRKTYTTDISADFTGELTAYLWNSQNLPLTKAVTAKIVNNTIGRYNVGPMTAKGLIAAGATLLDVRSEAEFTLGHPEGALNIDYTKVAELAESLLPNKEQPILVYCSAAKRSAQAVATLVRLGYTAVYNLGSMSNLDSKPMITFTTDTCKVVTAGEKVKVSFTASPYDSPTVYLSAGKDSTLADAVPVDEFTVPDTNAYYLTLKAYLVQDGVCYAACEKEFIFWSENTVDHFATDLTWTEATTGWGTIRKDLSVDGNRLTLAGKPFSHGIGTHATSRITMAIPEGSEKFLAVAGCDLEKSGGETMMFFVYIDGKEVDHSSLIRIGQYYVFDIDIPADAKTITLYAYEGASGGNTNDHADWCVSGFFNEITAE